MARLSYSEAVEVLEAGETAMVTHKNPFKSSDRDAFSFSGGSVTATTWAKLCPQLTPLNDGLFPDAPSQTFTWGGDLTC
ncbi:MAG: hypothetical protein JKY94_09200 [Rhodobacteraceae bacterium]|nr:hypothetical protein [Paracoccaceae bacterium]